MTTYNGEKYVIEQLNSIVRQSRQPTEVLIFDDCSSDNTVDIIRSYIKEKRLDFFHLYVNKVNLGWKRNFINAINSASGDIIFTADQDDIWMFDKIEKMTDVISANDKINLLACNYEILNMRKEKNVEKKQICSMKNTGAVFPVVIDRNFHLVMRPGCTYCFRKDFASSALKMWQENLAHDQLLWGCAVINKGLFIYDTVLMKFRRHNSNATGFSKLGTTRKKREAASVLNACFFEHLYNESKNRMSSSERYIIEQYIAFERAKADALNRRSFISWIKYNIEYRHYVYSLKSSLKDLYYII